MAILIRTFRTDNWFCSLSRAALCSWLYPSRHRFFLVVAGIRARSGGLCGVFHFQRGPPHHPISFMKLFFYFVEANRQSIAEQRRLDQANKREKRAKSQALIPKWMNNNFISTFFGFIAGTLFSPSLLCGNHTHNAYMMEKWGKNVLFIRPSYVWRPVQSYKARRMAALIKILFFLNIKQSCLDHRSTIIMRRLACCKLTRIRKLAARSRRRRVRVDAFSQSGTTTLSTIFDLVMPSQANQSLLGQLGRSERSDDFVDLHANLYDSFSCGNQVY